ncbi:hypothetical protein [Actinoallomurus iriomotensis]|uniref:Lipoprotein n=1 Tax=Actinoallomurus iriomotensis TaxID=478107 RepID=A0A9W6S2W9_9ACTN|nr:hypothetical protein [Actinoallomurus iriomotensis]GLY84777.1 hypothetical protein Airi02_027060 [Actinoallomurus iriomotensis]
MTWFRYAVALGVLLALAGCGGHGGTGASASSSANAQDTMVKFAQCMRQHGVQVDDPKAGDPGIKIKSKGDESKMNAAMQACRQYSPKKDVNPNDPQVRDRMLKMAQCLREHGLQVADPQPGQGLQINVNHSDPRAQQAIQTCNRQRREAGSATPGKRANGG